MKLQNGSQMDSRSILILCLVFYLSLAYINPAGRIHPKINVLEYEVGSSMNFTCFLNLSHPDLIGVNSSNIMFFNKADDMFELNNNCSIKIINESSAQLLVRNLPEMFQEKVKCKVSCKHNNCTRSLIYIDMANQINVGYKPQIFSFKCVATNYNDGNNLNCKLTQKRNPISTKYTLIHKVSEDERRKRDQVTIELKNNTSEAFYSSKYTLDNIRWIVITGNNALGNVTKRYDMNIHEILIPQQPIISKNHILTSNEATIKWCVNDNLVGFRRNFTYEISIFSNGGVACVGLSSNRTRILHEYITTKNVDISYNISLPNAYYKYDLEIRCKVENTSDDFYSDIATDNFQTLTKMPYPPKTTTGAFHHLNGTLVAIYWKEIPCDDYNGPNYTISFKSNNLRSIEPISITKRMGIFSILQEDTVVYIYSNNSEGSSIIPSEILIPKVPLQPPTDMKRILSGNGIFELSWKIPKGVDEKQITNFTIFWCYFEDSDCNDSIDFEIIDSKHRNYSHKGSITKARFAISMNSKDSTSGIIWFTDVQSDELPNNEIWIYIRLTLGLMLFLTICLLCLMSNFIKTKYYKITDIKVELPSGLNNITNEEASNHQKNFDKDVEKPLIRFIDVVNDDVVRMIDVDSEMNLTQMNKSEYLPVIFQFDSVRPIIPYGSTVTNGNQRPEHLNTIDCTDLKEKTITNPYTINSLGNNSGTTNEYLPVIVQSDIVQPIIPNVLTMKNTNRSLEHLNDSDCTNKKEKTIHKSNTVNHEYLPVLVQADIVQPIIPTDTIDNRVDFNEKLEVTAETLDDNLEESPDKYVKWKELEILSEEYTNASDRGALQEHNNRSNNIVQSIIPRNESTIITKNSAKELSNILVNTNLMLDNTHKLDNISTSLSKTKYLPVIVTSELVQPIISNDSNKSPATQEPVKYVETLDNQLEELPDECVTWKDLDINVWNTLPNYEYVLSDFVQ